VNAHFSLILGEIKKFILLPEDWPELYFDLSIKSHNFCLESVIRVSMKMKGKATILRMAVGFFLMHSALLAQNLVNNPSFESFSLCPSAIGQVTYATGWTNPASHTGSPDYLNVCGPAGTTNTANNYFGNQSPNSGSGYIGLSTWYQSIPQFREYVQTQLSSPLVAGQTYRIEMYVSLGDNTTHLTDGIQVHFRNSAAAGSGSYNPLPYTPQVVQPSGSPIGNKTNWTLFSRTFVAAGGEQYMVIGNFSNDASTSTAFFSAATYTAGYYFIDDVSLTPAATLQADLLDYAGSSKSTVARVYWKTTNEQQVVKYTVERSTDLINFNVIGEVVATGDVQSVSDYLFTDMAMPHAEAVYYRLVSLNTAGEQGFSRTLKLEPDGSVDYSAEMFPNPVIAGENAIFLWETPIDESVTLILSDLSGRQIYTYEMSGFIGNNEIIIPGDALAPGCYVVNAKGAFTRFTSKLVVNH
jgi:hypothetical protein